MGRFEGKVAVVTRAGIGNACVLAIAREGPQTGGGRH